MFASGKKAHDFIHTNTQISYLFGSGLFTIFCRDFFWAKNNKTPALPPIIQRPSLSVSHAALRCNESGAARERREKPPCLLCNYRWAKNEEERLIVCSVLCAYVCVWGLLWPLLHTEAYCTNTHTHTCTHTKRTALRLDCKMMFALPGPSMRCCCCSWRRRTPSSAYFALHRLPPPSLPLHRVSTGQGRHYQ